PKSPGHSRTLPPTETTSQVRAKQVQQRRQCGGDSRVQRIVRELVERHPGQLDALGVVDHGLESTQGLRDHRRIGPGLEVEDMSVDDLDARYVLIRNSIFLT